MEVMDRDFFSYFSHHGSCCVEVATSGLSRGCLVFCSSYRTRDVNLLPWKSVLNHFQISPGETGRRYWALVEQDSGGENNEIMSFVICLMNLVDRKGSGSQAASCHTMHFLHAEEALPVVR